MFVIAFRIVLALKLWHYEPAWMPTMRFEVAPQPLQDAMTKDNE
jgi:hypothetical protein